MNHVWATYILNEKQLCSAKQLRNSILYSGSHFPIIVLVSSTASANLLCEVHDNFAYVQEISVPENFRNKYECVYLKIKCWSLTTFTSVTLVPPNALVLRNCDYKFSKSSVTVINLQDDRPDSKVIHVLPCIQTGNNLILDFWSLFERNDAEISLLKAISKQEKITYEHLLVDIDLNNIGYSIWTTPIIVSQELDLTVPTSSDALNKEAIIYLHHFYSEIKRLSQIGIPGNPKIRSEPIAVIGVACRFPMSNNLDEFWQNLLNGINCIQKVPLTRWTKEQSCNQIIRENALEAGFLNNPVDNVDNLFFGINHSELIYTDPQQRLLMQVAWEALENAGIPASDLHGTDASIYVGMWTQDYKELMIESGFKQQEFYRTYMGNGFSGCSARLARVFGTTGETITLESGCASSMIALGQAVANLRLKKSNLAIACGVNLILKPFCHKDFDMVCSSDARCKSFDESANGYARSEGVSVIILKRLSDAVASNDNVLGIISGYGQTQDSLSPRMGRPSVEGETKAMDLALQDAKIHPNAVSYVEAHGTGTQIGDSLELQAITKVYCNNRESELLVGAVKSNIGHTESCSGMASIFKVLLAFKYSVLPRNINFNCVSSQVDIGGRIRIVTTNTQYEQLSNRKRIVGINNYGITGTNAHVIMEETPNVLSVPSDMHFPNYVLILSAKNERVLQILVENYINFLSATNLSTNDICSNLAIRRQHFSSRIAVIGKSISSLKESLQKRLFIQSSDKKIQNPKFCFLFPGQGFHIDNLGKLLFEYIPSFRKIVLQCEKYLFRTFGISVIEILWGSNSDLKNKYEACGVLVVQFAIFQVLKECNIKPDIVFGHSLGEYAAACVSGILKIKDALFLLVKRSELLEKFERFQILAVNCSHSKVLTLIAITNQIDSKICLEVVAENSTTQTLIAGDEFSLTCFKTVCTNDFVSFSTINIEYSYNFQIIEPIMDDFKKSATLITYHAPTCTYLSSLSAQFLTKLNSQYWVDHLKNVVHFKTASENLPTDNVVYIELGPKCELINLIKENVPTAKTNNTFLHTIGNSASQQWEAMIITLSKLYVQGFNVDWKPLYGHLNRNVVALPPYPLEFKSFWFPKQETSTEQITVDARKCENLKQAVVEKIVNSQKNDIVLDNIIDLKSESYLADHVVGNSVILPGAYYIENILRVLSVDLYKNSCHQPTEHCIHNFFIKKAIELKHTSTTVLQTKITDLGSVIITTQHSNGKNVVHCTANSNVQPTEKSKEFLENVITTNWDLVIPDTFYNNVGKSGIKFEESFRSLSSIYITHFKVFAEIVSPRSGKYIVHPILIDSMLQAAYIATYGIKSTSLALPVFIEEIVVMLPVIDEDNFRVYSCVSKHGGTYSVLINAENEIIIKMNGIDFAQTSLAQAEENLNKIEKPLFYQEVWKQDMFFESSKFRTFVSIFDQKNASDYKKSLILEQIRLNKAIGIEIYKAFCKILPQEKSVFVVENTFVNLPGYSGLAKLILHLLSYLEEDKYCTVIYNQGKTEVKWLNNYDGNNLDVELFSLLKESPYLKVEYVFASKFLQNLENFLQGTLNPLTLMFPVSKTDESSAHNFYATSYTSKHAKQCLHEAFDKILSKLSDISGDSSFLNIIEIGGGTGNGTKVALEFLKSKNTKFNYTFTDISSAFFPEANTLFENVKQNWQCKTLNIEKDPKLQGFAPFQYDIVVAVNVIHATSNLRNSLSNIRHLLKPRGILFLLETFAPQRCIDATFGLLPGYWNFTDTSLRQNHCLVSASVWKSLLTETGFAFTDSVEADIGGNGVVCAQASDELFLYKSTKSLHTIVHIDTCSVSKNVVKYLIAGGCNVQLPSEIKTKTDNSGTYYYSEADKMFQTFVQNFSTTLKNAEPTHRFNVVYFWPPDDKVDLASEISLVFLKLAQFLIQFEAVLNSFILVTKYTLFAEKDCHALSGSAPIMGFCRSFRSEYPSINIKNVDIDYNCSSTTLARAILKAIFCSDSNSFLAVRNGSLNYPQFLEIKSHNSATCLIPASQYYELCLPESKRIEDILFTPFNNQSCGSDEVEVAIEAFGVNFKDVLNITKPSEEFEGMVSVCGEFSGVITQVGSNVKDRFVGQRVCGCNLMQKPMQSIVTAAWQETVLLPDEISFEEGATLPVSFATAYYALFKCGKIVKGQSILIHSAAGGLGLMCVQLAFQLGLTIFVTAGSERKRVYLQNLGIKNVFNSRSLTFADEILNATSQKGVDVVVNTLTGKGFVNATVNCCSNRAKFIEVSKLNIWSIEEFRSVRPDLNVFYIDLSIPDTKVWHPLFQALSSSLKQNIVQPLPFTRFHMENLKQALKHITHGTHIGKIIVTAPVRNYVSWAIGPPKLFSSNQMYIVTGGLSGIGLEVALMLSKGGARNIVLLSRSPPSHTSLSVINRLRLGGTSVIIYKIDVSKLKDCKELIKEINKTHKIGGIFHSAGVLSDAIISKMEPQDILKVYEAKVKGTWNLHTLTCNMNLEYFVMFSSMAAVFGNIGQANHAAANSFMDLMAKYRHCSGYKALSINWGQWSETGSAVSATIKGLYPMSTASAIESLEVALANHYTQLAIFKGSVQEILHRFPWMSKYLGTVAKSSDTQTVPVIQNIKVENCTDLNNDIKKMVQECLAELLQIETEDIQENATFESIGVDSLISVELKNAVQARIHNDVHISANSIIEHNTLASFSYYVHQKLESSISKSTSSSLSDLILKDKNMCNDILPIKITAVKETDIKKVLVTGATGNMGMYLIETLFKQHQVEKIYCLVRNVSQKSIIDLRNFLVRRNISLDLINTKMHFVKGDMSKIYLDMDMRMYDELTEEIDAIFNFGAAVNHLEEYSCNKHCSVRNVNVIGVKNLIEFAVKRKIKWLFQASSLIAVLRSPNVNLMLETWPDDDEFNEGPKFGYSVSKYIADLILKRAVEYGVPCKVLRFPLVVGDSITGELDLQNKHFILRIVSYLKSGLIPDHKLPSLALPVDICVNICAQICLNKEAPSGVYNICHPSPQMEIEVVQKLQTALKTKPVKIVPYSDYVAEQLRLKKDSVIWPFIDFYTNPEKYETLIKKAEHMQHWNFNQSLYYRSKKLDRYLPGWDEKIETSFSILEKNFRFIFSKEPKMLQQF